MAFASAEGRSAPERQRGGRVAMGIIALCLAAGLAAIFVFALQNGQQTSVSWVGAVAFGTAIAGASLFLGALTGFLFGIPRRLQQQEEQKQPSSEAGLKRFEPAYAANTNLEQISDWLTKILVGVGLTNLGQILEFLDSIGADSRSGLGDVAGAGPFAVAITIYFFVGGFLLAYLATRLYLGQLLADAEIQALERQLSEIEKRAQADARALQFVQAQLDGSVEAPPQQDLNNAIEAASPDARRLVFYRCDRERSRNRLTEATKPKMERTIPVFRALIESDRDDKYDANHAELGFALKDQSKPDWAGAESALSRAISIRGDPKEPALLTYEANRAICRINLDQAFAQKKPAPKDIQTQIIGDLKRAIQADAMKSLLERTPEVKEWLTLNSLKLDALP